MCKQLKRNHQPSQPLRQDLELLGEMRSHIANLATIYERREQELLRKSVADRVPDRINISSIVEHYRAVCIVQDLEISVSDVLYERSQFWFHIGRLRLAWFLRATNILPGFGRELAARSLIALSLLSPRLLEVL